jgi:hypothetical protein
MGSAGMVAPILTRTFQQNALDGFGVKEERLAGLQVWEAAS